MFLFLSLHEQPKEALDSLLASSDFPLKTTLACYSTIVASFGQPSLALLTRLTHTRSASSLALTHTHSPAHWLSLICTARSGMWKEAFGLFNAMKKRGFRPTPFIYTSLFNLLAKEADGLKTAMEVCICFLCYILVLLLIVVILYLI